MKTTKKGFTLIELLVVIAIIGILSSVVLVSLNSSRAKARDAKRIADLGQLQTALALYLDDNGTYAPLLANLAPTYMSVIPTDPSAGAAYLYSLSDDADDYCLGATLEQAGSSNLDSDADCVVTITNDNWTADFTGTDDPYPVYDVRP